MGRWLWWDPQPAVDRLATDVATGVYRTAEDIQQMAIKLAPVRKAFRARPATRTELADFRAKLGKGVGGRQGVVFTGADIMEAASQIGIPLDESQAKRLAANKGGLQVIGFRSRNLGPNNLSWKKGPRSRIRGVDLRTLKTTRSRLLGGGYRTRHEFNEARAKRQGVKILGRAKREARRGVGVHSVGGRSQYGGFLRKNIVVEGGREGMVAHWRVVSRAPYSRYVEFPTSRTAAQPYLLPAFKAHREKLAENIRKAARR